jgi:uroporphyrinogen decarboxylase
MNLFQKTLSKQNDTRTPPIWFMRQAGRYHSHYQILRKTNSFLDVCKKPEVSAEAALGPIQDFDYDAAILFSDILFPLEAMGVPLDFSPGPQLGFLLQSKDDLRKYVPLKDVRGYFKFQADALKLLRQKLSPEKGMIGFVGGPLTIYQFAMHGSGKHEGSVAGLNDGRFTGFMAKLIPMLIENMVVQAEAGIDCMAVLDTSAGKLSATEYQQIYLPYLSQIISGFKARMPNTKLLYYSKGTNADYWRLLESLPIDGLGIDFTNNLAATLQEFGGRFAIQGNISPEWMRLPWVELQPKLEAVFRQVKALKPEQRKGWVCGLGHGILPDVPEENVRQFIALVRKIFT